MSEYLIPGHEKKERIECPVCKSIEFTLKNNTNKEWKLQCDDCSAILLFKNCPKEAYVRHLIKPK